MAKLWFDGKIIHENLLNYIQTREDPNNSGSYQAIAFGEVEGETVLEEFKTHQEAIDYVNNLGELMLDSVDIPDVIQVYTPPKND